jgi:outer membrane PBP1 activator LpoA protein
MQAKLRFTGNAVAVLLAAVLAACQISGIPSLGGTAHRRRRASRLAREGDHAVRRAPMKPPRKAPRPRPRTRLWLAAAGEWLQGAQPDAAEAAIANLAQPLAAADAREQARLDAEIALARGDSARAAEILAGISGDDAATLATRARVQFANLRVADAVSALMARDKFLSEAPSARRTRR